MTREPACVDWPDCVTSINFAGVPTPRVALPVYKNTFATVRRIITALGNALSTHSRGSSKITHCKTKIFVGPPGRKPNNLTLWVSYGQLAGRDSDAIATLQLRIAKYLVNHKNL
jgi:hypothetical protein